MGAVPPVAAGPSAAATAARYLGYSAPLHLAWEIAQLPLYTIWDGSTHAEQAFAILHCTLGDVLIAGVALAVAWAVAGRFAWPQVSFGRVAAAAIALGVAYTLLSEWLNVDWRGNWAYGASMPRVPGLGTGLAPLLQWLVVPPLAFALVRRKSLGDRSAPAPMRHAERSVRVAASAAAVFAFLDDPRRMGAHMEQGSAIMAGARMHYEIDPAQPAGVGRRIVMRGRVLGLPLFLEEQVVEHMPPLRKVWQTVGTPQLWVIGAYRMGFVLEPHGTGVMLRVSIDYALPAGRSRLLGALLGPVYARWCVGRIAEDAAQGFSAGTRR